MNEKEIRQELLSAHISPLNPSKINPINPASRFSETWVHNETKLMIEEYVGSYDLGHQLETHEVNVETTCTLNREKRTFTISTPKTSACTPDGFGNHDNLVGVEYVEEVFDDLNDAEIEYITDCVNRKIPL